MYIHSNMSTYKKNDIVKFVSKQPSAHVIRMFGQYDGQKPEDAAPEEYLGRVKSVIGDGSAYVVSTISNLRGFICILNADEIIGTVSLSELSKDEKQAYLARSESHEAPNVFDNAPSDMDASMSLEEKCRFVATKAVAALFPDAVMKEFGSFGVYDYRLEKFIADLDMSLENARERSKKRQAKLKTKRDELESRFRQMRFKEYYTICLGVEEDATEDDYELEKTVHEMLARHFGKEEADKAHNLRPEKVVRNWIIAIDLNFEEVSILRDISERTHFGIFLGVEYQRLYDAKIAFAHECLK